MNSLSESQVDVNREDLNYSMCSCIFYIFETDIDDEDDNDS